MNPSASQPPGPAEGPPAAKPRRPRRRVLWLILLVLGGGLVLPGVLFFIQALGGYSPDAPGWQKEDSAVRSWRSQFNSAGKLIEVEHFEPAKQGRYPVVMVVHGADGLQSPVWTRYYQSQAQALARKGSVGLLVHYLDSTGTKGADRQAIQAHFKEWVETLSDGVSYSAQLPGVEGETVGLWGTSLGSSLALALASYDRRVGVVVSVSGGLPEHVLPRLRRLPPTLLLHGADDRQVPLQQSAQLDSWLEEHEVAHEFHSYPGQGHALKGAAAADAQARALDFLARHLRK